MLAAIINIVIALASFLVLLSALIFIHEMGHYSVGRFFKTSVDRFSIGFGKPIWSRRSKTGTLWTISRIPLGGFVKFTGDAGAASNPDQEQLEEIRANLSDKGLSEKDIFHFKPLYQRALIVLAGPIANFLLAIILFAGVGMAIGTTRVASVIGTVEADSPAAAAGFEPGDMVLRMDGKDVRDFNDLRRHIALRGGTPILAEVDRYGQIVELTVTPEKVQGEDFVGGKAKFGRVGIALQDRATLEAGGHIEAVQYGPIKALGFGVDQTVNTITSTGTYIGRIFTGKENGDQLGSVVRIAAITGKSAVDTVRAEVPFWDKFKAFWLRQITLAASISVALGVANLIPIPVLDGGHLLYYGYEAVAGRPLSQAKQEIGFRIGFAVLLTLFVILTINDIGYVTSLFS